MVVCQLAKLWLETAKETFHESVPPRAGSFAATEGNLELVMNYYSPNRKQEWEDRRLEYTDLSDLVRSSDIVVICSPTNVEVLGKTEFAAIKLGGIIVQGSSGSPFSQENFKKWITQAGNYALFDMSAGLKNYEAYKDIPRVIFSQAVAGDTYGSNERRGLRALENLKAFLEK